MKLRMLPLSFSVLVVLSANAGAQELDSAKDGGSESKAVTQLDEVVVTSQKRVERLLDVPMSVTALSGEQLREQGVVSSRDLQQVVPGYTAVNNGLGFVPVIRGVSSQGTSPGDESNVSLYLDDVYIGAPMAGLFDLADVERVEVLKGPQGTLFGRNATGGAVRIVTRTPQFTPEGALSLSHGFDFGETAIGGYVTGGFSDTVAGSLSVNYRKGDGFVDGIGPNQGKTYGGPDNHLVRGKLLFQPSDDLSIVFAIDSVKSQNNKLGLVTVRDGHNPFPGSVSSGPYTYAGSTPPISDAKAKGASLDIKWDNQGLAFRSLTAYREYDLYHQTDNDRTNLSSVALGLSQYQKNFSQEFNLSGATDSGFNWVTGFYYYKSDAGTPSFAVYLGGEPGVALPTTEAHSQVDTTSYAAFADGTWTLSDVWHLTLGARYSTEKKDYFYQATRPAVTTPLTNSEKWNSPTFRAVLRRDLAKDANVYVSLSNGFKSGVFDAYSANTKPVDPEKVTALEVGTKVRRNGVTYSAAAFSYDYKDIQVASFETVQNAVVQSLTNAAAATMRGLELSAEGALSDNWAMTLGGIWMPTAEYEDFTTASVTRPLASPTGPVLGQTFAPADVSGSRVTRAPEWTINGRLNYSAPLAGGTLGGTFSVFHSPGFYWQPGNLTKEDAYTIANAKVSWSTASGKYTYSLWATNLTDEVYSFFTAANVRGDSIALEQGRQIGISFDARF